jgi:hypothetical protein
MRSVNSSIVEQDSLLESSQMQLFIYSNQKKPPIYRKVSLAQIPIALPPQSKSIQLKKGEWSDRRPSSSRPKQSLLFSERK